jgi:hypothetical protein
MGCSRKVRRYLLTQNLVIERCVVLAVIDLNVTDFRLSCIIYINECKFTIRNLQKYLFKRFGHF